MNKKFAFLFLVLLIAAISFSPRFSLGYLPFTKRSVDLRVEDILLFLGALSVVFSFLISGKFAFKKPPLFWPIFSWIIFGFFSISANLLIEKVNPGIFFFYFLKEIEFFIFYFLVFHLIKKTGENAKLVKYWLVFCFANILWLAYVFYNKIEWSHYYGPDIFAEPKGPFPSGAYFLIIFSFVFNIFLFYYSRLSVSLGKKIFIFALCLLPLFGVLASGSYTSIVGSAVSTAVSLFLYFFSRINVARFVKISVVILILAAAAFLMIHALGLAGKISESKVLWEYGSGNPVSRIGILEQNISYIFDNPSRILFGFGIWGEAHGYYTRVFLERGLVGLFIFFWLVASILSVSYRNMKDKKNLYKKGLSAGLFAATVSMLVMAVPNDVFAVVKPDEVYWFFTAMTMAEITADNSGNLKIKNYLP